MRRPEGQGQAQIVDLALIEYALIDDRPLPEPANPLLAVAGNDDILPRLERALQIVADQIVVVDDEYSRHCGNSVTSPRRARPHAMPCRSSNAAKFGRVPDVATAISLLSHTFPRRFRPTVEYVLGFSGAECRRRVRRCLTSWSSTTIQEFACR